MDKSNKDKTQLIDIGELFRKKYLKNQRILRLKKKMINYPLNYITINSLNHQNPIKKIPNIKINNFSTHKTKKDF